jgi:ComF family protein
MLNNYYSVTLLLRNLYTAIVSCLFPAFCTGCKDIISQRTALCNECCAQIKAVVSTEIIVTQKYGLQVYAVGAYQEPLKNLILAKSYQDIVACYYIAELMYRHMKAMQLTADYLVIVPLHWTRYAQRGYNQSEQIAYYISRWSGIPVFKGVRRTKKTMFQAQCSKEGRHTNVQDAFILKGDPATLAQLKHKRLLIIDDVMTTGATLTAVSRVLLTLKPLSLQAVVLARTM